MTQMSTNYKGPSFANNKLHEDNTTYDIALSTVLRRLNVSPSRSVVTKAISSLHLVRARNLATHGEADVIRDGCLLAIVDDSCNTLQSVVL